MTPDKFQHWLNTMRLTGLAKSDRECGSMLGLSANSIVNLKRNGADRRTALACAALLHNLSPYDPDRNDFSKP